jgi:2-polyprenyl-3-methyl-5-hydroxy-6-metoxy-1,4-benzoquinol methylase/glycosyltransferase involved in cell wall biosynthesis
MPKCTNSARAHPTQGNIVTLIASDSATVAHEPETDVTVQAFRDALSAFDKPDLSVLDIGSGCGLRLQVAATMQWKCFGVDPAIAEDALIATPTTASASFVVSRIEDLIPHAFDLIFVPALPEDQQAAATLLFKLFSIGAVTPATRVVVGVNPQAAAQAEWDPLLFLKKLHFTKVSSLESSTHSHHAAASPLRKETGVSADVHSGSANWLQASGSNFTAFMHERYVPGTWSKIAEYEHMPRYALAQGYAPGKAVLDFGCGTGYGSAILAKTAESVVGLDIDAAAMEWAQGTHQSQQLKFHRCSDLGASLPDASFDVVTCFEMIEHVDFAMQKATISNIARLLRPDGVLLISTPNPTVTQMYGENPYHLREMTLPEFHELLGLHFDHIEILEQRVLSSVTFETPGASPERFESGGPKSASAAAPLAFIAICANQKQPRPIASVFFDEQTDSIFEELQAERRANVSKMAVYTFRERLENANATIAHTRSELQRVTQALAAGEAQHVAALAARDALLSTKAANLVASEAELQRVTQALAAGEAQHVAALAARDALLSTKAADLVASEVVIAKLNQDTGRLHAQMAAQIAARYAALKEKAEEKADFLSAHRAALSELQDRMACATREHVQALASLDEAIITKDDVLARRAEEIETLHHLLETQGEQLQELARIKNSKWHRLYGALIARPVTLRNAVKSTYLVGAMASPRWVRQRLGPSISRLRVKRGAAKLARDAATDGADCHHTTTPPDLASLVVAENFVPVLETVAPEMEVKTEKETAIATSRSAYAVNAPEETAAQRPRVIHVIANFCVGGSSRLVIDLIECLGAEYEQSIVTSFIPTPPDYTGIQISEYAGLPEQAQFINHYLQHDPDFVHVHYWGDCDAPWYARAIAAAEQLGIPVLENVNTPVDPHFSDGICQYIYVSKYVQEKFGRTGAGHQTIFPGSDFQKFEKSTDATVPDDCIGMVYRLESDKLNVAAILPFIEAVKQRPATHALIVGGGSLLDPFIEATKCAGVFDRFEFTGYVAYDTLPEYYRRMSLFVAPVWKESFGQVSAFAMNMHIPVCGFDVGAISEIIDEPALVAPPGDATALAGVICSLLDDRPRRESLGRKMHQRAQDLFSQRAMIDAYAGVYKTVLEGVPR